MYRTGRYSAGSPPKRWSDDLVCLASLGEALCPVMDVFRLMRMINMNVRHSATQKSHTHSLKYVTFTSKSSYAMIIPGKIRLCKSKE